jgi:hypothetical protein
MDAGGASWTSFGWILVVCIDPDWAAERHSLAGHGRSAGHRLRLRSGQSGVERYAERCVSLLAVFGAFLD